MITIISNMIVIIKGGTDALVDAAVPLRLPVRGRRGRDLAGLPISTLDTGY